MTESQQLAANPDHSVWLSAHAGTGKTKVLIDRVMRILLRGDEPSSILCITYTKAAAAEMQHRLRNKLSDWTMCSDVALEKELKELLGQPPSDSERARARQLLCELLDDAYGVRIQTIHAFCQSLLGKFPVEAGIMPHANLMDDRTEAELLQEAKQYLIEQIGDAHCDKVLKAAFLDLATGLSDQGLNDLLDSICRAHKRFRYLFGAEPSLDTISENIYQALDADASISADVLLRDYSDYSDGQRLTELADKLIGKSGEKLAASIRVWLQSDQSEGATLEYVSAWLTDKGEPYKVNSIALKAFRESHPDLLTFIEDELARSVRFFQSLQTLQVAQFSVSATYVASGLLSLFEQLKIQRGAMSYDDIIVHAQSLLEQEGISSWVLEKLDQKLTHFLVDEAQDTAPDQWALVFALVKELFDKSVDESGRRSLFVVGDEKQSIYRFQGADPKGFKLWRNVYSSFHKEHGKAFNVRSLDRSFRSSAAILDIVDHVADQCGFKTQDDKPIHHEVHHVGRAGHVEIFPVKFQEATDVPLYTELEKPLHDSLHVAAELADQIAVDIRSWLDNERILEAKGRPVKPSDILILLQQRNPLAALLISALRKHGVPVAGGDRLKLNDHIAVKDLLAVAEWSLLPQDSLKLATVLKGPWFQFSEDDLYKLAAHRGDVSLWHTLQHEKKEVSARLLEMKSRCLHDVPFAWIDWMLRDQGGMAACKTYLGDEVEDLFDELLSQAVLFEEAHQPMMPLFMKWLRASDQDIKRELEQSSNTVRVMTVHGAKGLQAPIVMLPDTTRTVRQKNQSIWWVRHADEFFPIVPPVGAKSACLSGIKKDDAELQEEESKRLLYVALTRAESELYIYGYLRGKNVSDSAWYSYIHSAVKAHPDCQSVEEGHLRITHAQTAEVKIDDESAERELSDPPDWWGASVPIWEPIKIISPSKIGPSEEKVYDGDGSGSALAIARGNLTHRLLQWLPSTEQSISKDDLLFLANQWAEDEVKHHCDAIVDEVMTTWQSDECSVLFGVEAHSEVSLVGKYKAKDGTYYPISGQIDKLVVLPDRLIVADFKSNRNIPDSVEAVDGLYLRQLAMYDVLLRSLYPDREIQCALVWTAGAQWMDIPQSAIDETLESLDSYLKQT
ncbi:MAG: double-strand break repair helicase AddA [Rickettsiales bacterium]|nr:double-strand break repair helicase AddA [Rickettsiales bacterium]